MPGRLRGGRADALPRVAPAQGLHARRRDALRRAPPERLCAPQPDALPHARAHPLPGARRASDLRRAAAAPRRGGALRRDERLGGPLRLLQHPPRRAALGQHQRDPRARAPLLDGGGGRAGPALAARARLLVAGGERPRHAPAVGVRALQHGDDERGRAAPRGARRRGQQGGGGGARAAGQADAQGRRRHARGLQGDGGGGDDVRPRPHRGGDLRGLHADAQGAQPAGAGQARPVGAQAEVRAREPDAAEAVDRQAPREADGQARPARRVPGGGHQHAAPRRGRQPEERPARVLVACRSRTRSRRAATTPRSRCGCGSTRTRRA